MLDVLKSDGCMLVELSVRTFLINLSSCSLAIEFAAEWSRQNLIKVGFFKAICMWRE
jgi:hypothetical protein